ncbi:MAG: glycerol-3-phosphate dehydrogenase [Pseudomonadota bacterium]
MRANPSTPSNASSSLGASPADFDLLVIGGGVNGAGIARDAAGRGLRTLLCEQSDLASATSSASTKLIHGGLRYLEYYEFRLVREALIERETLLRAAPHIIWPLRFVLPHHKALRPAWILRLGLFLYDHLGGRKLLPPTVSLDLRKARAGAPLRADFRRAFEYSDCWVEDSRLVALNALDAEERGAAIRTRTKVVAAEREGGLWRVSLEDRETGAREEVTARAIANAAGPWVSDVLTNVVRRNSGGSSLRLVKGSHVIVRKLYEGDHAYIFQNGDGRIVFAIPYETDFTLLGTTDIPYEDDVAAVEASENEVDYVLEAVGAYLAKPVTRSDVVRTYSGVRPLYDDAEDKSASAVTRDYVFDLDAPAEGAPLLSIYGGKITTYRKLAEHALGQLMDALGEKTRTWTAGAALPGGDIPNADFEGFFQGLSAEYPWMETAHLRRIARAYGTRAERVLNGASSMADLGRHFGAGLTEAELHYLRDVEWARTGEDVLWRRSKLTLHLDEAAQRDVTAWMRAAAEAPAAIPA